MNFPTHNMKTQRGLALFMSLIMLLVLTVLGISGFHNSHIQERSAGNARLQSLAIEAAAAGASNAVNFFEAHKDSTPDEECGLLDHEGWGTATDWVEDTALDMGDNVTLKQRMYCLADEYPDGEGGRPARSQLFVLSRGEVTSDGTVVARRDVEVRLDLSDLGPPGDGCAAICFPSCNPGSMDFPNSNVFTVDGDGGPAITGGCDDMTDAIEDGIRDSRIGNYYGGVETAAPGEPWDSPENVEAFRAHIEATAMAAQAAGTCQTGCYYPGDHTDNGNNAYGSVGDEQVTYIDGDASFGGGVSGAGIMFVNGLLSWNGTPNFKGLIVTLGGTFAIDGGGTGGDQGGSVVILNQPDDYENGEFGESGFDNTGGGTASYKFDCVALQAAWETLDEDGQALWAPECEIGGTFYAEGPSETVIVSWRENIGWREDFFGGE